MAMMTDTEARRWERQLVAIAAGCLLFAVLAVTLFRLVLADSPPGIPADLILTSSAVVLVVLAVVVVVAAAAHHRWFFSARQRLRRDLGGAEGWLEVHDLRDSAGEQAVVTEAARFWRRPAVDADQAGMTLGELISGRWTVRERRMLAPYPRSAVVVGPQGAGKSQFLIPRVLDVPGAAVVTSTKDELFRATAELRSRSHGPIYVFDPLGITGGAHNFPYDPVWGCTDAVRADDTAAAMIRGAAISKRMSEEFWTDAGREILRCYLFAAASHNKGSEKVQFWVHNPDDDEPRTLLRQLGDRVPHGWLSLLETRLNTNTRQRDGYFATVSSCLDYLGHPGGRAATVAGPGRFDMRSFLDQRCTLYIIGDKSVRGMASMMTALTEGLAYDARRVPGGLGEPLVMALDEVANLTPVDLPRWTTEFRGYGVMPLAVIQSRAQLDKTWGEDDGKIIWDNLVTKIILPALGDEHFLEGLSRLAGERRVRRETRSTRDGGQGSYGLERVIPLHAIRALAPNHAFVIGIPRHPAVVIYEPGYRRLERERTGEPYRSAWPRWWRHPLRAARVAFELDGRR